MMRCISCANIIPDDGSSCPSCGHLLTAAEYDQSLILGALADEYAQAVRKRENPQIEDYERRHPELAGRIRDLFPALLALEEAAENQAQCVASSSAPTQGGPSFPERSAHSSMATRFISGTIVSGRYRIVGLLGKGGMGEVYRADDIKLGQQVALKFLPEKLEFDGAALARFHDEVRLARQISHPNVCRVFDIGEIEGHQFLSMEYIDGEDLASLLRRIGRLPHDKAMEMARQLCSGLATAHENNVLHCDLKPANVMVDGRGRVRITDFGLARLADDLSRKEIFAGTPAYMAPEQVTRREMSAKSDIYSLGLVLYEMFTGKRAFSSDSLPELMRMQERAHPVRPSKLVSEIDPAIERLILQCLGKDPEARPSLHQIIRAISGGDPLAAALAAGETPSPEMIAAAPREGALRPGVALAVLASFLACLTLLVLLSGIGWLHREVPLDMSSEILAFKAATMAQNLGFTDPPIDSASGFGRDDEYLDYLMQHDRSKNRWDQLRLGRPAALYFWYRQSPYFLVAYGQGRVTAGDPPPTVSGMINLFLDSKGRLFEFQAVPSTVAGVDRAPNWSALFELAGLEISDFKPAQPSKPLPVAHDALSAWEGRFPEQPALPIHIEAAAFRGMPVYFKISGPWSSSAGRMAYVPATGRAGYKQGAQSRPFFTFAFAVFLVTIVGGSFLARRNLWLGRGDWRGASRLGLFVLGSQLLAWIFQAHHIRMVAEIDLFYTAVAWALFYSVTLWVLYVALEPYVRRRWPYRIISWSRLLSGNIRDPMVGRDILIGALFGTASTLLAAYMRAAVELLGMAPDKPPSIGLDSLQGLRGVIGQFFGMQKEVVSDPLYVFITLLLLSAIFRKDWILFVVSWLLFAFGAGMLVGVQHPMNWAVIALIVAGYLGVLARFGLLATIAFQFYNYLFSNFPLTANFREWYAGATIFVLLATLGLALYSFRVSLAGQPVSRARLLGD